MTDVIRYEERDAAVTGQMQAGYPRFVVHPLVRKLVAHVAAQHARPDEQLWPTISARAAGSLLQHLREGRAFETDRVTFVAHRADAALAQRAKLWLQHTGGLLSSRGAEDALVRRGLWAAPAAESTFTGNATNEVRRVLGPLFTAPADHLQLAPSGMSAVHAVFRAISAEQAPQGRTAWVQLGWLYLDTIALLKKFTPDPARDHLVQLDVTDLGALEQLFAEHGPRIAGVFTEAPTNPLIQTGHLAAISALAWKHGTRVVVDPSISSPFNVDVLPHADAVTFSLTKYASHEGDVMAGCAVVNPARPGADALRAAVAAQLDIPYARDLARLAAEIGDAPAVAARINAATPRIVAFLEQHPAVARVWWSGQPSTGGNYAALARTPDACGGLVSFTLRRPIEEFYDRVALAKGPSFGMSTTLLCPYVYLAHYDLLPRNSSGEELARAGLAPELLRLSVGTEPVEGILAALAAALG